MANNPAVMRLLANPTPYPGAPPNPTNGAPQAPSGQHPGAAPGGDQPPAPSDLQDLQQRAASLLDQANKVTKELGYVLSDSQLHDQVPTSVEKKFQSSMDSITSALSDMSDAVDELVTVTDDSPSVDDPDDDGDDGDDDSPGSKNNPDAEQDKKQPGFSPKSGAANPPAPRGKPF